MDILQSVAAQRRDINGREGVNVRPYERPLKFTVGNSGEAGQVTRSNDGWVITHREQDSQRIRWACRSAMQQPRWRRPRRAQAPRRSPKASRHCGHLCSLWTVHPGWLLQQCPLLRLLPEQQSHGSLCLPFMCQSKGFKASAPAQDERLPEWHCCTETCSCTMHKCFA